MSRKRPRRRTAVEPERPLADLPLSDRARRVCAELGLRTAGEAAAVDKQNFLAVRGCGERTWAELHRAVTAAAPGAPSAETPTATRVELLPDELLHLPLRALALPESLAQRLDALEVTRLMDALRAPPELWRDQELEAAAARIRAALADLLSAGLHRAANESSDSPTDSFLQALPPDLRDHFRRRLGLGVPPASVAELPRVERRDAMARDQRLRQVLEERSGELMSRLRDELFEAVRAAAGVLTPDRIGTGTLAYAMAIETGSPLLPLRLVAFAYPMSFHVHKGHLVALSSAVFEALLDRLREATASEHLPLPLNRLIEDLSSVVAPFPRALLQYLIEDVRQLTVRADPVHGEVVGRRSGSVAGRLQQIIRELGRPVPLLDLMFDYRDRYRSANKLRLLTHLRQDRLFLEVGRDLWSLREWHEDELELAFTEANRAAEVIAFLGGRHDVRALLADEASERAVYLVLDCLRRDQRVRYLGRGEFCPAKASRSVVLADLARDFRRAMGEMPLERFVANTPRDRRRLVASLLRQNRMFVEPRPDRIDLLTNYPFNRERLAALRKVVGKALEKRRGYTRVEELLPELEEAGLGGQWLTGHLLADILRRHGGFEVLPGGMVALASLGLGGWISARAREAIRAATVPLTTDEIASEVPELAQFAEALAEMLENDPMVQSANGTHFCVT